MTKNSVISFERSNLFKSEARLFYRCVRLEDVERRAAEFDGMLRAWEMVSKGGKVARELRDQTERPKRDIQTIDVDLFGLALSLAARAGLRVRQARRTARD
jgi:hypothetical protein